MYHLLYMECCVEPGGVVALFANHKSEVQFLILRTAAQHQFIFARIKLPAIFFQIPFLEFCNWDFEGHSIVGHPALPKPV